jgi:hypothetical protein
MSGAQMEHVRDMPERWILPSVTSFEHVTDGSPSPRWRR